MDLQKRRRHLLLAPEQPVLNGAFGTTHRLEGELLLLRRDHPEHLGAARAEGERGRVVEELEHVLLHGRRVGGAQDLQQLVVREEIEAGERGSLRLEVVGERLLARLEVTEEARERRESALGRARLEHVGVLLRLRHDLLEGRVDAVELFGLLGKLQPDVLGADKDGLEVHPLGLHLHPHVDHLRDEAHQLLPFLGEVQKGRDEARGHHRGQVHHLVLERLLDLVRRLEHEATLLRALEVLEHLELLDAPRVTDLVDAALDRKLLGCPTCDLNDLLLEAVELHVEERTERERLRVHVEGDLGHLHDLLPVALAQRVVLERLDERQRGDEAYDRLLNLLERLERLVLFGELLQTRVEDLHALLDHRHVQLRPEGERPVLALLLLLRVDVVDDRKLLEVRLDIGELRVRLEGEAEEAERLGEKDAACAHLGEGLRILCHELDALVEIGRGRARAALDELVVHGLNLLDELGHLALRDDGELLLDAPEGAVRLLGLGAERRPVGT